MNAAQLRAESARRRIRAMYEAGNPTSRIAKLTGVSYTHTKQIVEQIKQEERQALTDQCTAQKLAAMRGSV